MKANNPAYQELIDLTNRRNEQIEQRKMDIWKEIGVEVVG